MRPILLERPLRILSNGQCATAVDRHQQSEDVELVTVKAIVMDSLFDVIAGDIKEL